MAPTNEQLAQSVNDLAVKLDLWLHQTERLTKRILRLEVWLKDKLKADISNVSPEDVPDWLTDEE